MARQGNDLIIGMSGPDRPIILRHDLRLHHTAITGTTGTGKSRFEEGLVRQDIRLWPKTKCGMLVIDPHGELFDGIMAWVTATDRLHLPIIPIDFRRKDQIIGYNVLRQHRTEPSVIIDNFVQAMSHVWGQGGTDETPLFEQWATNVLYRLYHERKTLADAAEVFSSDGLVISDRIVDPIIRRDWERARRHRKEFETEIASSVRRFRRFLLNPTLRAVFGQTGTSLDFGKALEEGHIVLVSLARNGGTISRQNADLFATLLLADLWAAADERGKNENAKPFYVYLDEFQRFLTPTMAENLAEAQGFGIGMTLANQFPRQILNGGNYGQRIYDEVLENTRTKIVFRLRSRGNLEPMAEATFMNTFDPEQIKFQHYSTKVLDHQLTYLPSVGLSTSATSGGGKQQSQTRGKSFASTDSWSHTDTVGRSLTEQWSDTIGSDAHQGQSWSGPADSASMTSTAGASSVGGSLADGTSSSSSVGGSETESYGESDSIGGSETRGTSEAETNGSNVSSANSIGVSLSFSPVFQPVMGKEASQPLFRSIDEQIFIAMAKIARLKDREAYVLVGDMSTPQLIRTPDVVRPEISNVCTELCVGWYQRESGLSLPLDEALRRVTERDLQFNVVAGAVAADADFEKPGRRLINAVVKNPENR